MTPKPDIPDAFIPLGEPGELLIHESYWRSIPPPAPSWMDQQLHGIRGFVVERRWRTWGQEDWISAILYCGLGLALLQNALALMSEVRRAAKA